MKRLLLCVVTLLVLPACELIFGGACGGADAAYFDVTGVQLSVFQISQPVNYSSVGLIFSLDERYYGHQATIGMAAYACKPSAPGYFGTKEGLDSLVFTSRYDYDATHPAGTPLNDILRTSLSGADSVVAVKANDAQPPRYLNLMLRTAPAQAGPQQFIVRYRQTNGEIYTAETQVVELQR